MRCDYGIILFRRYVGDCRCRCDILASRKVSGVSDVQIGYRATDVSEDFKSYPTP